MVTMAIFEFWSKMTAETGPNWVAAFGHFGAQPPPKRSKIASATQPRLFIDFEAIGGPIFFELLCFWASFWVAFLLARRFRRFQNT